MSGFTYGARSTAHLNTCHPDLRRVAKTALVVSPIDITIVCGLRQQRAQDEAFAMGLSRKRWPDSRHNGVAPDYDESTALDFAPWINGTIHWNDTGSFYVVAGIFLAAAGWEGVKVRYGGDWDRDGLTRDQSFMDLGHLELA